MHGAEVPTDCTFELGEMVEVIEMAGVLAEVMTSPTESGVMISLRDTTVLLPPVLICVFVDDSITATSKK